jgi:hypothetical protein
LSCNCNDNQVAGAFEPKMKVYKGSNCCKHKKSKCNCCCCQPCRPYYPKGNGFRKFDLDNECDEDGGSHKKIKYSNDCWPPCDCDCFPPTPPPNGVSSLPFPPSCSVVPLPTEDGATLCLQQLKYILSQIIVLYAGQTFEVLMDDGITVTGTPDPTLYITPNNGMLVINTLPPDSQKVYINIANIISVRILNTTYGNNLKYILLMCDLQLGGTEASIRKLLQVGSTVIITASGIQFDPSVVLASVLGVVILQTGSDIQIVSTSKISSVVVV